MQAEKLRLHIESGVGKDNHLSHVAYSLVTSRIHFQQRLVVTAGGKAQMLEKAGVRQLGLWQAARLERGRQGKLGDALIWPWQSASMNG